MSWLITALQQHQTEFHPILPKHLQHGKAYYLNMNDQQNEFSDIDPNHTNALIQRTQELLTKNNAVIAIGRYAENRSLYQSNELFSRDNRSFHLGIDLMVPAGTKVYAPTDAIIHSFKDNNQKGDYGPSIILQHQLDNRTFYTLYGHLSRSSLTQIFAGKPIRKGEHFATIGDINENGQWPPHVHFQIITALGEHQGDFPGVVNMALSEEYMQNCPDPNLILQIKA